MQSEHNQPSNVIIKIIIITETEVIWQKAESLSLFAFVSWQHITACFGWVSDLRFSFPTVVGNPYLTQCQWTPQIYMSNDI